MADLYTIGYATKSISEFIEILKLNNIDSLVDVRTSPFSKQFPEYNENNLKRTLKENGIIYLSFKEEFGARRIEPEAYIKKTMYNDVNIDVVSFERVYQLEAFKSGYNRIEDGIVKGYNIAFMCSEKYAYDCHRGIMVAEFFYRNGYTINHIVDKNTMISHEEIEVYLKSNFEKAKKSFQKNNLTKINDMRYEGNLFGFDTIDENTVYWNGFFGSYSREKAFELRNYEIGYKKGNEEND